MKVLDNAVAAIVKSANQAEEKLILRWMKSNPCGGELIIVRWIDGTKLYIRTAVGSSKEEQEASRPTPTARWVSCVGYQVPSTH